VKHPSIYSREESGNTFVHILVGIAIIAIVVLVGWRVAVRNDKNTTSTVSPASTNSTTPAPTAKTTTAATTPMVSPGTDNASLTNDLNSVNGQLSAQSADNSSVNAALNDQKSEITVPTN
jgi:cytoskeletal protein RodZ